MLTVVRIAFGAVCTLKAVSLLFSKTGGSFSPVVAVAIVASGLLMIAASVALMIGYRPRVAASVVVATGLMFLVPLGAYSSHLYLLILIALILAVNLKVELLLKFQLTVVYLFGTLAKLNEVWLSGTDLYIAMVKQAPFWETFIGQPAASVLLIPLSIGVVVGEGFLAVGFWFRGTRWVALAVGVGLHGGILIMLSTTFVGVMNLLVFGGLMFTLYIPFFSDKIEPWWERRSEGVSAGTRLPPKNGRDNGQIRSDRRRSPHDCDDTSAASHEAGDRSDKLG